MGETTVDCGIKHLQERFRTKLDCLAAKIHILFQISYFSDFYLDYNVISPPGSRLAACISNSFQI